MQRDSDGISPKGKVESWVRVKRPSSSVSKKELDDANKINALSRKYSAMGNLNSRWQNWSSTNTVNQKLNPFSEDFDYEYSMSLRLHKGEDGYGRPKEDTKTAERARRAEQHIHGEIADMCYVIRTMNDPDPDGKTRVTFRELFDRYVRVSDKVVGILLRAKRHGKVAFDGEMLWQGQDDGVIMWLPLLWNQVYSETVHCNLSQNGMDHQMCPDDVTSHLEEEPLDQGAMLDDDSPTYQDVSPGYQRRSPPQRSVSESELSRSGNVKLSKPVALWTQQDVCKWLKKHCPKQHQIYSDSFKQHDITGRALMRLTDRKLERMGIMQEGQRQYILQQVLQLRVREEVRTLQLLTQASSQNGSPKITLSSNKQC
ncbi:uncharacterized protein LOC120022376 [Salvelinus namaycush]|uniref:Actin-binding Rho-activating protein n=1 Tax=Salvelinus namaycush TaxID=8040 RepID=A0A8U0TNM2_SALNM|nr:uncharacterized protein LOC120022376 [Salvelinus namaycush]